MKKLIKISVIALMALLSLNACTENENLATLNVELNMPEGFTSQFNGKVVLTSEQLGKSYVSQAENGTAVFNDIYPGLYELQAHQEMTQEEAAAAAPELKIENAIQINGINDKVVVELDLENKAAVSTLWSVQSTLVISRVYCNGSKTNAGDRMMGPKYYEIFNNSNEVQYLDGLCLAAAHGMTTGKGPCELYEKYTDATYVSRIVMLPGKHGVDKNILLEPGKSFVIAWNARNFIVPQNTAEGAKDQCTMTVDLSTADYEIEDNGNTRLGFVDNANVPDMKYAYDCQPGGSGFFDLHQAMIIFFASKEEIDSWETDVDTKSYFTSGQKAMKAKRVDNKIILDGVETVKEGTKQYKRIANTVDMGLIPSSDNLGFIFDRKVQYIQGGRIVLQDTNNSTEDFVAVGSRDAEKFDGSHLVIRDYTKPEIQPAR